MIDATGNVNSVLLLGGSSDIGLATVRQLTNPRLQRVVLAGRPSPKLDDAAEGLRAAGIAEVETVDFDAADVASHAHIIDSVFASGSIDVVIVAFGLLGDQRHDEQDTAAAIKIAQVNYVGAMSVCMESTRHLVGQGHGALVLLSSVAGERARRSNFIYGSSKAAIDTFALGLAEQVRGTGARVIVVRPGFVTTSMTEGLPPAPASVDAETVGRAIREALSRPRADLIYVPKKMRVIMSVLRHIPRPVFRKLPL